jgi:formylglycine-generating enzyme required for sulfatase activity
MRTITPLIVGSFVFLLVSMARADIGYQFVTVGNPGNVNDPATGSAYGGVSYTYDIGAFDVTLNQYTTFLNAVAQSDPYGLYYGNMGTDGNILGIQRTGSSGSYFYSVVGSGNRPVSYISWFDAARFANWMQNGQPVGFGEQAGTTETGAYTLNGDTTGGLETKNANAVYWIPTESEWYKAAYYDPTLNGGAGGYWSYATRSNTTPGNDATHPGLANQANYNNGVFSVTQSSANVSSQNYLTDVGAFTNSASAYGTYDQNGEVWNWNDAVIGSSRGLRGGPWNDPAVDMASSNRSSTAASHEAANVGFRLASLATIPEPNVVGSLVVAGGLLLAKRRRKYTT